MNLQPHCGVFKLMLYSVAENLQKNLFVGTLTYLDPSGGVNAKNC